ncbi:MAG: DUF1501 domain-containing protein [Planctomycetota bacterium]
MKDAGALPTRRDVLRFGACAGAVTLASGARAVARATGPGPRDTLVVVFLRGGLDGLSLVVPYADGDYYAQRPATAVPQADTIDLDGFFGLNRAAAPLHPLFSSGRLAFVHTCGFPHPTRSHFEAMRRIEEAEASGGPVGSGWLARHLDATSPVGSSGRAIAVDRTLPTSLQGGPATLPIPRMDEFRYGGPVATRAARVARLDAMYRAASEPDRGGGLTAQALLATFASIDFAGRVPAGGAVYPPGTFGAGLYEAATLIKSGVGMEAIEVDLGGWDDHSHTGPVSGDFAVRSAELADGLAAFLADLEGDADRTTVLVHSEFGRRVDENGSGGSDHGRAGVAMVLGGTQVLGGVVHRQWTGLATPQLDDGALPVHIDLRDVIGEILVDRLHTPDVASVLRGHVPTPLGLVQ